MNLFLALAMLIASDPSVSAPAASPVLAGPPGCTPAQLLAPTATDPELKAHRHFELPVVRYPFDTKLETEWGFALTLRVDESGQPVCYAVHDIADHEVELTPPRLAAIADIASHRYEPFRVDDVPAATIVEERIVEEELPEKQVPLPSGPLESVKIALHRSGCYGTCPSYSVTIAGDGMVVWRGDGYTDVEGNHRYRISPQEVQGLLDKLRAWDLWSLRSRYAGNWTDHPTYTLTLEIAGQTHVIEDYLGTLAGMPKAVRDFEDEVDRVGRSGMWVNLSMEAVRQLEAEGFDFHSKAAENLLASALQDQEATDESAMLRMIELGTPVADVSDVHSGRVVIAHTSLIELALQGHRSRVANLLLQNGALLTGGKLDRKKLDAAFRAAIVGGRLASVQAVWNAAPDGTRPSLVFHEPGSESEKIRPQESSVALLLRNNRENDPDWEGLEIVQWLAAQGVDLKARAANGDSLLHIATDADDARLVRYLLDQGLDASTRGEFGLPALGNATSEDIALMLLEAGTNLKFMDDAGGQFRAYAEQSRWPKVIDWLTKHGK